MNWEAIKGGLIVAWGFVAENYLYFLIGGGSFLLGAWLF